MSHKQDSTASFKAKEKALFNDILQFYDNKQFKLALKNITNILSKHPDHPETLALKALVLNGQKKRQEAFDQIKLALFKNLSNVTCWHIYGILHRSDKNYVEARKAFMNALKYDPDNQNVLRDVGQLQIKLRDYEGYIDTRRKILVAKPDQQQSWIAYAVANYLNKNHKKALEILDSFEKTLIENKRKLKKYQRSEFTLFEARILEELGDHAKALRILQDKKKLIVDKITKFESIARIHLRNGEKEKAIDQLEELLQLNSSNYIYYYQILQAHGVNVSKNVVTEKLSEADRTKAKEVLEQYEQHLPRATAHQRILLKLLTGEDFKQKLLKFATPQIVKGVPQMLVDLKELYADSEKVKAIEEMLGSMVQSMKTKNVLREGDEEEQDPTVYLWLLYFSAQHFYFLKDFEKALTFINEAIEHTPTVPDLYIVKAKIFKKAGDVVRAAQLYDEARKLDEADRFLNAHSSKYKIKADQLAEADETMAMFSKDPDSKDLNVHDMQCMWYELEVGNSHQRQGNYRQALKSYNYIEKHLEQIHEDQTDFHLYSINKGTLNAYFQMIAMEDKLYTNPYGVKAAVQTLKLLRRINVIKGEEVEKTGKEYETYQESEDYKKLKADQAKRDEDEDSRHDIDPKGYDLYLKTLEDPLAKALQIANLYQKDNYASKELQAAVIPIFLAQNKPEEALKSLKVLVTDFPAYHKTHSSLVKFFDYWISLKDDKVREALSQEVASIGKYTDKKDLEKLNEEFLTKNASSINHAYEYVKLRTKYFGDKDAKKLEGVAVKALEGDAQKNAKIPQAVLFHKKMVKYGLGGGDFQTVAKKTFPHATYFHQ